MAVTRYTSRRRTSRSERVGRTLAGVLAPLAGLGALVVVAIDFRPEVISLLAAPGILLALVVAILVIGHWLNAAGRRELAGTSAQILLFVAAIPALFFLGLATSGSDDVGIGILLLIPVFAGPYLIASGVLYLYSRRQLRARAGDHLHRGHRDPTAPQR